MWEMPSGRAYGAACAPAECIRLCSLSFVGGGSGAMGLLWNLTLIDLRGGIFFDFSEKVEYPWTVKMDGCIGANMSYALVDFEHLEWRCSLWGLRMVAPSLNSSTAEPCAVEQPGQLGARSRSASQQKLASSIYHLSSINYYTCGLR